MSTIVSASCFPIRCPPPGIFLSVNTTPGSPIRFLIHCSDYVIPLLKDVQCLSTALKMKSKQLGTAFICIASLVSCYPT